MKKTFTILLIVGGFLSFSAYGAEMLAQQRWTFNNYNQPIVVAKNNKLTVIVLSEELIELHRLDIKCNLSLERSVGQVNLMVNNQAVKFVTYCNDGHRIFTPETVDGTGFILYLFQFERAVQVGELTFTTNNFNSIIDEWQKMNKESI
ncbi:MULTISPECIES: hypothetical protein [Vibrio]|uniref:hypothetical protein n=1 Tax=Vibrio TaxID=662 RepID=UPI0011234A87|nr:MULTISPECIES: hypothetical protein [Vibrio]EGQ7859449.1 hypothetical protein [Vibrio parahaemolyticus]ELI5396760.1 hypothetical protein [Vibrio parahaemolyticus]ELK8311598.1 hypothetical protein [Vibrio vulnificus]ELL0586331.1 hypothetical protein [Vibrio vulnificus]MCU8334773.1 hypothetical protein [Vibrio vulnificus]